MIQRMRGHNPDYSPMSIQQSFERQAELERKRKRRQWIVGGAAFALVVIVEFVLIVRSLHG